MTTTTTSETMGAGLAIDMIWSPAVMSTTIAHERGYAVLADWLGTRSLTLAAGHLPNGAEWEISYIPHAPSDMFPSGWVELTVLWQDGYDGEWVLTDCFTLGYCWDVVRGLSK